MLYRLKKSITSKDFWTLLSMAVPGLSLLFLFHYLPLFGIILSFKSFKYNLGILSSPWTGFENLIFFFKTGSLSRLLRNTLGLNLLFLMVGTIINVIMALLLYEINSKVAIQLFQTVIFLPFVLSWISASFSLYTNLSEVNGIFNSFLAKHGREKIMWYAVPEKWPFILLISFIWKTTGFGMIINYGNLLAIDKSYFEAAMLDGASRIQQMRYISIPFIRPIVVTMFILSLGRVFNADFGMFFYLPKDSSLVYETTDVIDTYVYRALRVTGDVGMSSAVGLCQSVAGFIVLIISNRIALMTTDDGGII